MFVDEDKGDDNESGDEDAPAENQSQVPQNAVYWSSMQREIDVENFSFRLGPTKNLGDIATAKDFFNQFLDDDYLDQIVRHAIAYARSKGDNNLARKHSKIAQWNSDNPCMNLPTFLFICYLKLSVENFLNCCKMHLFHGSEHHVHVAYRKRATACGFVRQIVLLGALQASLNTIIKRFFSFGSLVCC